MSDSSRLRLLNAMEGDPRGEFAAAVREGLSASPKRLPCRFFYDGEGSRLFERICQLPEYYLTRVEAQILSGGASEIAGCVGTVRSVIELGSGIAQKTEILLEALLRRTGQLLYCPIDVCEDVVQAGAGRMLPRYAGLRITAAIGEYEAGLARLQKHIEAPALLLWLGSNIGNLDREASAAFLRRVAAALPRDSFMVIGVDLRKDRRVLEAAYDDAAGVTSAFNKNILGRINRELGGEFAVDEFEHRARYVEDAGRIEMHLISRRGQHVRIEALGMSASFEPGEAVHTEDSYKYSEEEVDQLLMRAGLECLRRDRDDGGRFAVVTARAMAHARR